MEMNSDLFNELTKMMDAVRRLEALDYQYSTDLGWYRGKPLPSIEMITLLERYVGGPVTDPVQVLNNCIQLQNQATEALGRRYDGDLSRSIKTLVIQYETLLRGSSNLERDVATALNKWRDHNARKGDLDARSLDSQHDQKS